MLSMKHLSALFKQGQGNGFSMVYFKTG